MKESKTYRMSETALQAIETIRELDHRNSDADAIETSLIRYAKQLEDEMNTFYVWKNEYGTLSIDTKEHGHYASMCLGEFETREEAEQFVQSLPDEE